MLKIKNLTASYENEMIFSNLSYEFEDRKKYAITGRSGIGKTTLLHILCGLKAPDSGEIETNYTRPAYIFQDSRLFPWLTAIENLTLVSGDKTRAEALLTSLLFEKEDLSKYPHELSGGMKQRVSIARALCFDGDILLMDEPFKGLDKEMKQSIRKTVFDYAKNKTVIIITHDADDTKACDVILKMNGSPVMSLTEESGNFKSE